MTPAIRLLAEAGNEIDLIVSDNGSHETLRGNPYINRTYLWIERDGWLKNLLRLRSKLQLEKYETAYALYPNGRRENTLLFLARASRKKCYVDRKYYYRLLGFLPFTEKIEFEKQHDAISNINLVRGDRSTSSIDEPEVSLSEDAEVVAERFYKSHDLNDKFVVAVQPGGGNSAKRWSEENYLALCKQLARNHHVKLLIFGSESEAHSVNHIAKALRDDAFPVCGQNISHVSALVRRSQLVIANDSSLIHIASAFDIPVVAIWGYTDFHRTAPFSTKALLIRIDYPCSPCYEFGAGYIEDCKYHLKCIRNISSERVYLIVALYISLLTNNGCLDARLIEQGSGVKSVKRIEGGCLMVNVSA